MYDLHCHILPGIDDGPDSLDQALEMCRIAAKDGIRGIVATPHHANGIYTNTRDDVLEGVATLNQALGSAQIDLTIYPGTEVHFHAGIPGKIQKKEICTYDDARHYVLIELPVQMVPQGIKEAIFELRLLGITPIIAHPERNLAVQDDIRVLVELVHMGALCQVTAQSVLGAFGLQAEKTARRLFQTRLAHVIASDAHSQNARPPKISEAMRVLTTLLKNDPALCTYVQNISPLIAQGKKAPEPPPCDESVSFAPPSLWTRLRSWL
jgi:protein-tyrosine phosphatase